MNLFICFHDIRDAKDAFEQIETVNTNWSPIYISQTEYAMAKKMASCGTDDKTAFYDGQVVFTAQFEGLSSEFQVDDLFDNIHELAKEAGEVLAFAEMEGEAGQWKFRAEYYNIEAAKEVVTKITNAKPARIGVSESAHEAYTSRDIQLTFLAEVEHRCCRNPRSYCTKNSNRQRSFHRKWRCYATQGQRWL